MVDSDFWSKTGELFGSLIEKPKMVEKFLKKPPPKYVYDIIISTMAVTGFPKGLFTAEEEDGKYFDAAPTNKLEILQKTVDITKIVLNDNFEIKTTNILKGDEPEKTNYFLQAFHRAATSGKDFSKFISKYLEHRKKKAEEKKKTAEPQAETKSSSQPQESAVSKQPEKTTVTEKGKQEKAQDKPKQEKPQEKPKQSKPETPNTNTTNITTSNVNLARPKTPFKKPEKIANEVKEVKEVENVAKAPTGLIVDSASNKEVTNEPVKEEDFNAGNTRSATGMKLDTHIFKHHDIIKDEGKDKQKSNISLSDLDSIKNYIQEIMKNSNPIGKIIEFLSDDIESMNRELGNWIKEGQTYKERLDEEIKKSDETLLPLQNELLELEDAIRDEHMQIKSIKCRLIKNEQIIQNLINNVISFKGMQ